MTDDKKNIGDDLDNMSTTEVDDLKDIVRDTDHPYTDPVTGKPNEDVPHEDLGVALKAAERKAEHDAKLEHAADIAEEDENANEWEDPELEGREATR